MLIPNPLIFWLVCYVFPALVGIIAAKSTFKDSLLKAGLFYHTMLGVSLALAWNLAPINNFSAIYKPDTFTILLVVWAILSLWRVGGIGLLYNLSALLQQAIILGMAQVLLPTFGILVTITLLLPLYVYVHNWQSSRSALRFSLITAWGIASIILMQTFHLFWLNVLLHGVFGVLAMQAGILLEYLPSRSPKPHGQNYLIVPIPKNPYSRIGPKAWQDWVRQARYTAKLATKLQDQGHIVQIALITNFQPAGKPSEIELYTRQLQLSAPNLTIVPYHETFETGAQVEKAFALVKTLNSTLIFTSAWLQYPRVLYLARGRKAEHRGVFGIPQPAFAFIDPICLIFQPLTDILGLTNLIRRFILSQRAKGRIL